MPITVIGLLSLVTQQGNTLVAECDAEGWVAYLRTDGQHLHRTVRSPDLTGVIAQLAQTLSTDQLIVLLPPTVVVGSECAASLFGAIGAWASDSGDTPAVRLTWATGPWSATLLLSDTELAGPAITAHYLGALIEQVSTELISLGYKAPASRPNQLA